MGRPRTEAGDYLLTNAGVWVREYFDVFDLSVDHVDVVWDRRFTRTIAMAEFGHERVRVALSPAIYPTLLPVQRVEVVAHEVCHLAAWSEHGLEIEDHGPEWIALMEFLGFREPREEMFIAAQCPKGGRRG